MRIKTGLLLALVVLGGVVFAQSPPFSILNQPALTNRPYPHAYYNHTLPNAGAGGPLTHLMPYSDAIVATFMQSGAAVDAGEWNTPGSDDGQHRAIYYGQSADPVYQISGCTGPSTSTAVNGMQFHAPSAAPYQQGSFDRDMNIWDQTSNVIFTFYGGASGPTQLPSCPNGTPGSPCDVPAYGGFCSAANYATASGIDGGTAASSAGLAPLGNMIRMPEVYSAFHINHGIRLVYNCAGTANGTYSSTYVFPANTISGNGGRTCTSIGITESPTQPRPPEGSLIFLDYTSSQLDCFNPAKASCSGVGKLPGWQFALVESLTMYGGTLEDTGNGESIRAPGIESEEGYYAYQDLGVSGAKALGDNFPTYMNNTSLSGCLSTSGGPCQIVPRTCTAHPELPSSVVFGSATGTDGHSCYQWNLTWSGISSQGGKAFWQHMHVADPCIAIGLQGLSSDGHGTSSCVTTTPPSAPTLAAPVVV